MHLNMQRPTRTTASHAVPPPFFFSLLLIVSQSYTCSTPSISINIRLILSELSPNKSQPLRSDTCAPQHTSAYLSIRQSTSAVAMRHLCTTACECLFRCAYLATLQHTSAYVGMRQHTSAYVSLCYLTTTCECLSRCISMHALK